MFKNVTKGHAMNGHHGHNGPNVLFCVEADPAIDLVDALWTADVQD